MAVACLLLRTNPWNYGIEPLIPLGFTGARATKRLP